MEIKTRATVFAGQRFGCKDGFGDHTSFLLRSFIDSFKVTPGGLKLENVLLCWMPTRAALFL